MFSTGKYFHQSLLQILLLWNLIFSPLAFQTITMTGTCIVKVSVSKGISYIDYARQRDTALPEVPPSDSQEPSLVGLMPSEALKLLFIDFGLWTLGHYPLQTTSGKTDLLIGEVAWRCRQMKAPVGLTVVSSTQRIEVVRSVLPQLWPQGVRSFLNPVISKKGKKWPILVLLNNKYFILKLEKN